MIISSVNISLSLHSFLHFYKVESQVEKKTVFFRLIFSTHVSVFEKWRVGWRILHLRDPDKDIGDHLLTTLVVDVVLFFRP